MESKTTIIMYSIVFIALAVLAIWVVKPFILTIIAGIIIAYIFHPVYRWILKRVKSRGLSAFLVAVLIILIFTIPLFFVIQAVAKDAYVSYIIVKQKISATLFVGQPCTEKTLGCSIINAVQDVLTSQKSKFYVEDVTSKLTQWAINKTNDIITKIPLILLQVMVLLFVIYYSLKDGERVVKKAMMALPLKQKHYTTIIEKMKEMINSTVYGIMVVAVIQGILAGIGYFIFGIKSPVILGILTALAALLPVVGTAIVWAPTVAIYFTDALISNNSAGIIMALALLAYCIFPVSLIDNFLRPKIIGDKAKVHPLLVLLGILGGVAAFGMVGILIGPIIITLFVVFIDIYHEERLNNEARG